MKEIKTRIVVAITCFNRAQKTVHCITALDKGNPNIDFTFVVVDDHSTDDTVALIRKLDQNIVLIETDGNLFYSRGMKKALDHILSSDLKTQNDYLLLANDDVDFYQNAIEHLLPQSNDEKVIVGATCDSNNKQSYGAVIYPQKGKLTAKKVQVGNSINADTFNANCVLIPMSIFTSVGSFDDHYVHGLGDYDYGLTISKAGYIIRSSVDYVGVCENNDNKGTWQDRTLGVTKRLRLKEKPKGSPSKIWWYYVNKHFGLIAAIKYSISPFVKIVLGK